MQFVNFRINITNNVNNAKIFFFISPSLLAVSYTHLDVYKRQMQACTPLLIPEKQWNDILLQLCFISTVLKGV